MRECEGVERQQVKGEESDCVRAAFLSFRDQGQVLVVPGMSLRSDLS